MRRIVASVIAAMVVCSCLPAIAQQDREENLRTCLSGKYPSMCRYDLLTADERAHAKTAEIRENLSVCLTGKYPSMCNHSYLTPQEAEAVVRAELAENLSVCRTGKYPSMCNHAVLTPPEAAAVNRAERAENLRVCLSGKYPSMCSYDLLSADERARADRSVAAENLQVCLDGRYPQLCNRSILSQEQLSRTEKAEAAVRITAPKNAAARPRPASGGTCYDSLIMSPLPFMGNNGEVFKLSDGSLWRVMYEYEYMYQYYPSVVMCPGKGIVIVGGKSLHVEPLAGGGPVARESPAAPRDDAGQSDMIESRIDGEFTGWTGETIFKLQNGQIWQQSSYAYRYRYAYSPKVIIYRSGSGYRLRVEGVDAEIAVVRLK